MISISTYTPNPYEKKTETKTFSDSGEAFNLLNSWSKIKHNYTLEYIGKKITQVDILFKYGRPELATVHYKSDNIFGMKFITLNNLLDSPEDAIFRIVKGARKNIR